MFCICGKDLTRLEMSGLIGNTKVIGIIKEVVSEDEDVVAKDKFGLKVFQTSYFRYPVYLDELRQFIRL